MSQTGLDHFDTIVAARPTDASLQAAFHAERRAELLASVLGSDQHTNRTRRGWPRWLAVAAAAVLMGVALIVRDAFSGGDGSRAEALAVLAQSAGQATDLTIPDGGFLQRVTTENPNGPPPSGPDDDPAGAPGDEYPRVMHSWTASDGRMWRCDVYPSGATEYLEFDPPPADWSPAAIAGLPTDPDDLMKVLGDRASGSSSHEEAIFVGVQDILMMGYTPPAVQQAAIESLATLDEVTVRQGTSPAGRQLLEVRFHDRQIRGPQAQSMWFDESTGLLVETSTIDVDTGTVSFDTVYEAGQLVDAVPAEVLALANPTWGAEPPLHEPTTQPVQSCQ